jgi:putative inorganic carbon (HCO3(-)) transporter
VALCLAISLGLVIALLPLMWATLLILGSIIVVVTVVEPRFGVLLVVLAVPFGSVRQVNLDAVNVGVTEALVGLVLAAWLMRMVARRTIRVSWPPLALPLAVFLGILLLSSLGATSLQHSLKEIVKWVEVLALYVFVASEMDAHWSKALVFVFLSTGALAALQGIYQFLLQVGPEEFVLFGRFMRAYGTFEQPNPYAGYLGLTLPLAVGLVVAAHATVGQQVRGWWLVWAAGTGALMLIAIVMSWSRGAWLGVAAAALAMFAAAAARRGRVVLLGALFAFIVIYALSAGGLSLAPSSVVQRFADFLPYLGVADVRGVEVTDANFAVLERMAHWQSALEMWKDHPWLGVGIGNYEPVYAQYALPLWGLPLGHAHNYYLNVAAEAGFLGLIAYLFLWGAALLAIWRTTRRATGWHWGVALGVLGVLVHLSVHNFFDNLYVHGMYLHVAILLGMGTAPWAIERAGQELNSPMRRYLGGYR